MVRRHSGAGRGDIVPVYPQERLGLVAGGQMMKSGDTLG